MTSPTSVRVQRTGDHQFRGSNDRGAEVALGIAGQEGSFTPAELLLVAIGGCAHVTGESLLVRRVGDEAPQEVTIEATKDTDESRFPSVRVSFNVDLSGVDNSDEAATTVLRAVERLCTVSRTVQHGADVTVELNGSSLPLTVRA
jgi:uncharacterized OsmC-like protein